MPLNNADRDWEKFGKTDPYYAVLTEAEYHGTPTGSGRAKFFESGERHIEEMFTIIRSRLDPVFAPSRALDFGCGVGRLLIPLAARCPQVVGMDVSPSMLAEAQRNCDGAGARNVDLVRADDELSTLHGGFDFIHSYIVLQHIPTTRGEALIRKLAQRLRAGGVAMFHITYASGLKRRNSAAYWARLHVPGANALLNLVHGRAPNAPIMQMNSYSATRVLDILRSEGCHEVHVRFSDHGGARGLLLFARKGDEAIFI